MGLFNFFTSEIAIDLGTANTLIMHNDEIVVDEPSIVALDRMTGKVLAIGKEAQQMHEKTHENIKTVRPLRDGVIADYTITEAMLSYFMDKACGQSRFFKPEVMICIPSGVTQVERRAVLDAAMSAGAKIAYLIDEPLAAAIGAKIPIAQAAGHMIVNIGGGSTESAVISLGGVVVHSSVRVAGNKIDEAIISYIRRKFNLLVGETTSERIKIDLGNAIVSKTAEVKKIEIRGRDTITGLPRSIELDEHQVNEAILPVLMDIISGPKEVLEQCPPELASDIIDKGIVMSGGTSLLRNLDKLMTEMTGVPCHVAEEALLCVVKGTGVAMENIELYKRSIVKK